MKYAAIALGQSLLLICLLAGILLGIVSGAWELVAISAASAALIAFS
jgi:hypothetical protein